LLAEAFSLRLHFVSELLGELFEELPLARGQRGGNLDGHLDQLITAAAAGAAHDALALDAQNAAGLRARWDFQLSLSFERRNLELAAEGGLNERDGDRARDVVARALEERMRSDRHRELEIPGRAIRTRRVAAALHGSRGTLFDARRDGDRNGSR